MKNSWVDYEEYILPEIKALEQKKEKERIEYKQKIDKLESDIISKKLEYNFLTGLLTTQGYGEILENNVKKTLEYIGYKKVIDVDKIVKGNRQDDLRILDDGRFTVIEVKGHNGNPTEDDCQALLKYINRNMRAEERTDVHGILIVNHNKLKASLDRINPAFTEQQISDAIADKYTLVSTWELYKAVRLWQKELITFEDINVGLHTEGLFTALSDPWQFIGKIEKQFHNKEIDCFDLKADKVRLGDELIIENGNEFFKINVEEMKIDDKSVNTAKKRDKVSINIKRSILGRANIYVKNK